MCDPNPMLTASSGRSTTSTTAALSLDLKERFDSAKGASAASATGIPLTAAVIPATPMIAPTAATTSTDTESAELDSEFDHLERELTALLAQNDSANTKETNEDTSTPIVALRPTEAVKRITLNQKEITDEQKRINDQQLALYKMLCKILKAQFVYMKQQKVGNDQDRQEDEKFIAELQVEIEKIITELKQERETNQKERAENAKQKSTGLTVGVTSSILTMAVSTPYAMISAVAEGTNAATLIFGAGSGALGLGTFLGNYFYNPIYGCYESIKNSSCFNSSPPTTVLHVNGVQPKGPNAVNVAMDIASPSMNTSNASSGPLLVQHLHLNSDATNSDRKTWGDRTNDAIAAPTAASTIANIARSTTSSTAAAITPTAVPTAASAILSEILIDPTLATLFNDLGTTYTTEEISTARVSAAPEKVRQNVITTQDEIVKQQKLLNQQQRALNQALYKIIQKQISYMSKQQTANARVKEKRRAYIANLRTERSRVVTELEAEHRAIQLERLENAKQRSTGLTVGGISAVTTMAIAAPLAPAGVAGGVFVLGAGAGALAVGNAVGSYFYRPLYKAYQYIKKSSCCAGCCCANCKKSTSPVITIPQPPKADTVVVQINSPANTIGAATYAALTSPASPGATAANNTLSNNANGTPPMNSPHSPNSVVVAITSPPTSPATATPLTLAKRIDSMGSSGAGSPSPILFSAAAATATGSALTALGQTPTPPSAGPRALPPALAYTMSNRVGVEAGPTSPVGVAAPAMLPLATSRGLSGTTSARPDSITVTVNDGPNVNDSAGPRTTRGQTAPTRGRGDASAKSQRATRGGSRVHTASHLNTAASTASATGSRPRSSPPSSVNQHPSRGGKRTAFNNAS